MSKSLRWMMLAVYILIASTVAAYAEINLPMGETLLFQMLKGLILLGSVYVVGRLLKLFDGWWTD